MRKRTQTHVKQVYRRFLYSFFAVLVLPIVIFFFLFLRDYYQIYQNMALEQAQYALNGVAGELDRELESLWAIAAYNNEQTHMQDYNMKGDYTAGDVKSSLAAERITHPILSDVFYYTQAIPSRVYSYNGTCSWDFFIGNYIGEENEEQILEILKLRGSKGWYLWGQKLYYVVTIEPGKVWLFSISSTSLQNILNANPESGSTVLLDSQQQQIFPTGAGEEDLQTKSNHSVVEITSVSSDASFSLVRTMDKGKLFAEVYQWRVYFLLTIALVLFVGTAVSFWLASYNERPVKELQDYCKEKNKNIPEHVEGFEAFRFAMQDMESKAVMEEEKRKQNNLLLQLLHGGESVHEKLTQRGLFLNAQVYCVLVVLADRNAETEKSRIELYLKTEISPVYEAYRVNIEQEEQMIFIVGMKHPQTEALSSTLLKMIDFFQQNLNQKLLIYMGEFCDSVADIQRSYLSILTRENDIEQDWGKKLILCSRSSKGTKHVYPNQELDALYKALEEADMNRVHAMTEGLISIMESHEDSRFLYLSIYHDVVNAYYRAQSKLILNLEAAFLEAEQLEIMDQSDAISVIQNLEFHYRACIEKKNDKGDSNQMSEVIAYIEENKTSPDLTVSALADNFGMSISNLSHRFRAYTGEKISDYITEKRFEYAVELLLTTDYKIMDVAEMLGYTQTGSFIRKFKQYYGVTPAEYRAKNKIQS